MNRFVAAAVAGILLASAAQAQVTEQDLANDQASTENVLTNGMGRNLQRFSPLTTLNKTNVDKLVPVWAFSLGGEKQRGQETQPLVYDGVMYITGSYSRLYAMSLLGIKPEEVKVAAPAPEPERVCTLKTRKGVEVVETPIPCTN